MAMEPGSTFPWANWSCEHQRAWGLLPCSHVPQNPPTPLTCCMCSEIPHKLICMGFEEWRGPVSPRSYWFSLSDWRKFWPWGYGQMWGLLTRYEVKGGVWRPASSTLQNHSPFCTPTYNSNFHNYTHTTSQTHIQLHKHTQTHTLTLSHCGQCGAVTHTPLHPLPCAHTHTHTYTHPLPCGQCGAVL